MEPPSSSSVSPLAAALEGLHPARVLVCAIGAVATVAACQAAATYGGVGEPSTISAWTSNPPAEARRLASLILTGGPVRIALRLALAFAVLGAAWSLLGGWIARGAFLSRLGSSTTSSAMPSTPLAFVMRKRRSFLWAPIFCVLAVGFFSLFPLVAGWVHRALAVSHLGAPLVALLLPILLVLSLLGVLILCGSLSYPLMPAAIAAEGTDTFDAFSRGFSYFYARTLRFALYEGIALVVAAVPPVLAHLGTRVLGAQPGLAALWALALGLSLSCFWSAQPAIYLDLRREVDGVAHAEVFVEKDGPAAPVDAGPTPDAEGAEGPATPTDENGPPAPPGPLDLGRMALDLRKLFLLFSGLLGLGVAVWLVTTQAPPLLGWSGPVRSPRELSMALWGSPALVGAALAAGLLGALLVLSTAKAAGRIIAVEQATRGRLETSLALAYARRTGVRGASGAVLFSCGALLLGVAVLGPIASVAWTPTTAEAWIAAGSGIALLGLGALSLAAACVGDPKDRAARTPPLGLVLGGLPEVLPSGVRGACHGLVCSLFGAVLVWGTWTMARVCLTQAGGPSTDWLRAVSGLGDVASLGGLEACAVYVTRAWLLLFFGLAAAYPAVYALAWGTRTYLRLREVADRVPSSEIGMSEEESAAIARGAERKKALDRFRKPSRGTPKSS